MTERLHLLLPLASSVIYVLGSLMVRRAADLGVGVWRNTFVGNVTSAVMFAPLAWLGGPGQPLSELWQPAVLAMLLVSGQVLGYVALTRGDVTVATPVLGVKTVVVAFLSSAWLGVAVPWKLWCAAGLSSGGIALLSRMPRGHPHRLGLTLGTGLAAAAMYAFFDVCVQRWAPRWGAGRLLPLVMGMGALFSVGLMPLFREPLGRISPRAWKPLLGGALCVSLQGVLLITTVAVFGDATAVNVVYSMRSLWTVIAVWGIGHWFHMAERLHGPRILAWRLGGAALMTAAVVLAVA